MKSKIHEIVFEAETFLGRAFDLVILVLIIISVGAVMLESVDTLKQEWGVIFLAVEWIITTIFTFEYILRVYCVKKPWRYIFSFYGLIDLLAILPAYLSLFIGGAQSLLVIRGFRLLRVFRIFKLGRYVGEADVLVVALKASRYKITVFLFTVLSLAVTVGAAMYLIEGKESGFTSIPRSIYWSIVTITTVGYGDITPQTIPGQILASFVMIMGYGILAVPTGIVSVEIAEAHRNKPKNTEVCSHCLTEGHAADAKFCRVCGNGLSSSGEEAFER